MNYLTIIGIALSVAMDAFAVSLTIGLELKKYRLKHSLKVGCFCGVFQMIMPLIGFFTSKLISASLLKYNIYIASCLLSLIGLNMVYKVFKDQNYRGLDSDLVSTKKLFTLALLTSLDALAIGISLTILEIGTKIYIAALSFGIIAFCLSFIGVKVGKKFGDIISPKAEYLGGLSLLIIGISLLF